MFCYREIIDIITIYSRTLPKESDDLEMEGVDSSSLEPHEQPGTELISDDHCVVKTFGYFRTMYPLVMTNITMANHHV